MWQRNLVGSAGYRLILVYLTWLSLLAGACRTPATEQQGSPTVRLIQYYEDKDREQIDLAPGITVPSEAPGYTLFLPDGPPQAMVVLFHSGRDSTHPGYEQRLYRVAVDRQVAALYVTTGNPFEFLFDSARFYQLDRYIGTVVDSLEIAADKILFAGMSLAGTRAMKFAQWCLAGHSRYALQPGAVAICDAPLDFDRFWRAGRRAQQLTSHPTTAAEASWVNAQLEKHLGGTPLEVPAAYRRYSPYTYGLKPDPKLELLQKVAVRAYSEPDMDWWIKNRRRDYYATNAIDAAALINDLLIQGHSEAELILTHRQGHHPDGRRHPHSWSIVDNAELIAWLVR